MNMPWHLAHVVENSEVKVKKPSCSEVSLSKVKLSRYVFLACIFDCLSKDVFCQLSLFHSL